MKIISFDKSTSLLFQESIRDFSPLYEFSTFPIIRISPDGEILFLSPSFESCFGYKLNDLRKNNDILYKAISRYDIEKIRKTLLDINNRKVSYKRISDIRIIAKDTTMIADMMI